MVQPVVAALVLVGTAFVDVSAEGLAFTAAVPGRSFSFPQDHGKHPDFQTERWYFTGNLASRDGNPWGFQLTFFRRSMVANPIPRPSRWAVRELYLAHFAITN